MSCLIAPLHKRRSVTGIPCNPKSAKRLMQTFGDGYLSLCSSFANSHKYSDASLPLYDFCLCTSYANLLFVSSRYDKKSVRCKVILCVYSEYEQYHIPQQAQSLPQRYRLAHPEAYLLYQVQRVDEIHLYRHRERKIV